MKSLITLLVVLGVLSFGFVNNEQSLGQSFAYVGTGLFFLGLAAHLSDKYSQEKI
jgi:hypothetical protein